ncbi:F-box/kelch-repeat protein At3g06240-like [Cornus florida]|uniref:F-box/kelch-repeat protein At3g06240-like n=1 Tax=Cornus florida TaxID=4283 RepID=UPI0028A26CA8|nr:F-box/kelch-repeat protein At3g06240-like [Cornus florida]
MAVLLPDELVREILTRLPAKALLKFRCVCKSWCSLISSPDFITSNLNQTIRLNKINNTRTHLIAHYIDEKETGGRRFSVKMYNERLHIRSPIELHDLIPNCGSNFRIFGSCNGLVCLTDNDNASGNANSLILWNPSIEKSVRLPMPSIGIDSRGLYSPVIGYGFDAKTNDYKVVRITCIENIFGPDPDPEVELYSLNRGCWRRISVDGSLNRIRCTALRSQAFVNGVVHWIGRGRDETYDHTFLTFDMSSEVFGEMGLPLGPVYGWVVAQWFVSVLGESLCVGHFDVLNRNFSMWVMKEYGVVDSWTKLCNSDVDRGFGGRLPSLGANGLLLFGKNDSIFSINLESRQAKNLGIQVSCLPDSCPFLAKFYSDTYMESLVLLKEVNQVSKGQARSSSAAVTLKKAYNFLKGKLGVGGTRKLQETVGRR